MTRSRDVGISSKQTGIISLILTTFFWGSTFVLVKETVSIIPLDGFLAVRFFLGGILLFPFGIKTIKAMHLDMLKDGAILGTLLYLSFWFQTVGLTMTTPAKAAFITGLNVVFVPILGVFFGRALRRIELTLSFVALIGLALMTLDISNFRIEIGDAIIVLTAIAVALHVLYTERVSGHDPIGLVIVQLFVVSTEAYIVAMARGTVWNPFSGMNLPYIVWVTLVVTSVLATAFAFFSQTYSQNVGVPSSHIAIIFALEPIFALLIDIFRGVIPNLQIFIGMLLILFSNIWIIKQEFED